MNNELFLDLGDATPAPKKKVEIQEVPENSLRAKVQLEKQSKKAREQEEINAVLAKKDDILKCLLRGVHYRPDGDDSPETMWLAGRGGRGIKLKDGRIARVAMVALYPSTKEINHRPQPSVLVGPSGQFLDKLLTYSLDNLDDVYRTNLIKYFKKPKTKLTAAEKQIGKAILFEELKAKKIDYVICLGAEVYDVLCKEKKRFSASRFRGVFLPPDKAHIPVRLAGLQNPAFVISPEGEKELQNFEDALRSLFESIHGAERAFAPPPFRNIEGPEQAAEWVQELEAYVAIQKAAGNRTIFGIDTEMISVFEGGTLEPKEMIMLTTAYGNQHAETVDDLHCHCWTFLKTPDWTYESGQKDTEFQESFGILAVEDDESEEKGEEKRVNLVFDSRTEKGREIKAQLKTMVGRGKDVAWLDEGAIARTALTSKIGISATRSALTRAIGITDETILQHGHYDKRALEVGLRFNWDAVNFEADPANPGEMRVSTKLKELMVETLTLNENDNRGLKEVCAKTLGWKGYDIPLEMFKAEHDIDNNYSHISWSRLSPYAVWDVAGTVLARLVKQRQRIKKWTANKKAVVKYYDKVEKITGHKHSDPEVQTPERVADTLNQLMVPLYRIKKTGMPVGDAGMKKVRELVDFYSQHYEKLRQETRERSLNILGVELNDPGSTDIINFVLYGAKEKGGLGLEPFKEPGKGGRLWSRLNADERLRAAGSGAIDAESFGILADRLDNGPIKDFVTRLGETRQIKSIMDNFFSDPNDAEKGFFSRIGADLRLHTEYMPTTETLRFRSQPNLANPPKKEAKWVKKIVGEAPPHELRNIITAEPGHVLMCRDWSSAEVYLLMYRSNDPAGLDVIAKGLDFHVKIGLNANKDIQLGYLRWRDKDPVLVEFIKSFVSMNQKDAKRAEKQVADLIKLFESKVEKDGYKLLKVLFETERDKIKPVTFGVPYGQTEEALARLNGMSLEEGRTYIQGYHDTYKAASGYLKHNGQFGVDFRMMPSPWGYLRNFSPRQSEGEVERQAFNLALQHGVACLMNQALIDWENAKKKYRLKSEVFLSLYDAIGWHIPENEAKTIAEISHEIMSVKRPVGPFDSRQIPTEGCFSNFWEGEKADGYSFQGLNLK